MQPDLTAQMPLSSCDHSLKQYSSRLDTFFKSAGNELDDGSALYCLRSRGIRSREMRQIYILRRRSHARFVPLIFEIPIITFFVILLAVFQHGRYLPRSSKVHLNPGDVKFVRFGPGYGNADGRAFGVAIIDPFNLNGILSDKDMKLNTSLEHEQPAYEDNIKHGGNKMAVEEHTGTP